MPARLLAARAGRFALIAALALVVAVAIHLSRRSSPTPAPVATSAPPPAAAPPPASEKPAVSAPAIPAADGYIGATACEKCHAQQHARWLGDGHRRGLSDNSPAAHFADRPQYECLTCHTTGLRVAFDSRVGFQAAFIDAGSSCESCHGPGGRHAETRAAVDIVQPGRLLRRDRDRQLALALCAQCHGARQTIFPIVDSEHRYRAGQRDDDTYQPTLLVNGSDRSPDYFSDGRPASSGFEVQALAQSRCFLRGQVTCLSCHTAPHREHDEHALHKSPTGRSSVDESCRPCHGKLFNPAELARHTQHKDAAAQSCVACHMPKVVRGTRGAFADHAIDVPVPENRARHGVADACSSCHKEDTADDLAQAVARLWPGAARRQARRLRLADALDERTAASSQPALLAVLADDSEAPMLRASSALLLGQRFPEAIAAVLPLLQHREPLVRTRAVEAIGYARARNLADRLAPLLTDRSIMVRHATALLLARMSDPRAEGALRKLARDPETSGLLQPHFALGLLAMRQGDLVAATTRLEQAVRLAPYFVDGLVALSDVYVQKGQPTPARDRLSEALRIAPDHRAARERLSQLR